MKKAFFQLHTAVFLAGFTGVLGRLITLNEAVLVWYRMMITCVVLWLLLVFRKRKPAASRKLFLQASSVGFILALHWVTFYAGIKISNVSTALVCLSAMGFFTAILEPIMLRSPFDITEVLLGLLAIAGISIVFHFDPHYKTGIIISLFSALLASIFPDTEPADSAENGCRNGNTLSAEWWILIHHNTNACIPVFFSCEQTAAFPIRLLLAAGAGHSLHCYFL